MANTLKINVTTPDFAADAGIPDVGEAFYTLLGNIEKFSNQTATGFTAYDPDAADGGLAIDVVGTGFVYNALGVATAGTVTSFSVRNFDGRLVVVTAAPGTAIAAVIAAADAFANSGFTNSSQLDAIFGKYEVNLTGNNGVEEYHGLGLADTLFGDIGNDILDGGLGNDTIQGGAGSDTLDGGVGTGDTVSYAGSDAAVTVYLNGSIDATNISGGHAQGDLIKNFENLTGSKFDDELAGDGGNNVIDGGDGNDYIVGYVGNDTLNGGTNDDKIQGSVGADTMDGGAGIDTLDYSSIGDATKSVSVTLGAANVQMTVGGSAGSESLGDKIKNFENVLGGAGNDTLIGNADANVLNGGGGNDALKGLDGADTLEGGDGNDILVGGKNSSVEILDGGNGADTVDYSASTAAVTVNLTQQGTYVGGNPVNGRNNDSTSQNGGDATGDQLWGIENVIGSNFNDVIVAADGVINGGAGNDTITDGLAKDILIGGLGDDLIISVTEDSIADDLLGGAAGNDTVSYAGTGGAGENITLSLATQFTEVNGAIGTGGTAVTGTNTGATGDRLSGFEHVIGGAGDDKLTGTTGNNTIEGGAGADTLEGGTGNDTLSYAGDAAGVNVVLQDGIAAATVSSGDAAGDVATGFENLLGGGGKDILEGNSAANAIEGGTNDDLLRGKGGNDTLRGGFGDDELFGGAGADVMDGGSDGLDILHYDDLNENITLTLSHSVQTVVTSNTAKAESAGDKISNFEQVVTGKGNDSITGSVEDDIVYAGEGNDVVQGMGGADNMSGEAGVDTLTYDKSATAVTVDLGGGFGLGGDAQGDTMSGFEILTGSKFNDTLIAANDTQKIDGGLGDDIIRSDQNAQVLIGGLGINTLSYAGDNTGVTVALLAGKAADVSANAGKGNHAEGDTATGFVNLTGGIAADTLTGDAGNNIIEGGAGADKLAGGGGNDTLSYASSTSGVNITIGGAAAGGHATGDIITWTSFRNLTGGTVADTLNGDVNANTINGNGGNDDINGNDGNDTLNGGVGDDSISGGIGNDTIDGGDGDDFDIAGGAGNDILRGGAGEDSLNGDDGNDTIDGGADNDVLDGDEGNDTLMGGAGDDFIEGRGGADTMDGGAGIDWLSYDSGGSGTGFLTIDLQANTVIVSGNNPDLIDEAKGDKIKNFENIEADNANDTLRGTAGVNVIAGGDGNDLIEGRAGADDLDGEGNGGVGDTVSYESSALGVTVDLTKATQVSNGDANGDILNGFENILGSAKDDLLTGDDALNTIAGGKGNDVIQGGDSNDILDGGEGVDTLDFSYSVVATHTVTLGLANVATNDTGNDSGDQDSVKNFENITGGGGADKFVGNTLANILRGGAGADILDGGAGDDTIEGGDGDDSLTGGAGVNTLSYANATGGIQIDLSVLTEQDTSGAGKDTISGFTNIIGSEQTDGNLSGNDANNSIEGRGGDDYIFGGKGLDTLLGGVGEDTIMGFSGGDTIDGGADNDWVAYQGDESGGGITLTLGKDGALTGFSASGGAAGDKITNVEHIIGSDFIDGKTGAGDKLTGNNKNNELYGNAGNDILDGKEGADTLQGGTENDSLTGGTGADFVDGGAGVDTASYAASLQGVTIDLTQQGTPDGQGDADFGLPGTAQTGGDAQGDLLWGIENLVGSAFNDMLTGDTGANKLEGGAGNDKLLGGDGADTIIGGLGDDFIGGGDGVDALDGGLGIDTLSYAAASDAITVALNGAAAATIKINGATTGETAIGFENIIGGAVNDILTGDALNNVIEGGAGADTLDGKGGVNTLSYASDTTGVSVDLGAGTRAGGDAAGDIVTFASFMNVTGGNGNDNLRGNTGNNILVGGEGDDTLNSGGGGADIMNGGLGFDFTDTFGGVSATIDLAAGMVKVGTGSRTLLSVESVRGTDGNDTFTAMGFSATSKNAGSVSVGNNLGTTNQFQGMDGDDTILGNGSTRLSYQNADAGVTVDLDTGVGKSIVADTANVGVDTIISGVNAVRGSAFNDILKGSDILDFQTFDGRGGGDTIDGRGGSDRAIYSASTNGITATLTAGNTGTVNGGASSGNDTLTGIESVRGSEQGDVFDASAYTNEFGNFNEFEGLGGNDTIIGNGETRIAFYTSSAAVTVDLGANTATGADIGTDTLTNDTIKSVRGSDFDDIIRGNGQDNALDGRLGNDSLEGTGGVDRFVYSIGLDGANVGGGNDVILDFAEGQDEIDLSGAGVANYAEARAKMTEVTGDVLINFGGGNTLTIENIDLATLDANQTDFLFR